MARPSAQRRRAAAVILLAAFASFIFPVWLWFTESREEGMHVGLWVPSILSAGTAPTLAKALAVLGDMFRP